MIEEDHNRHAVRTMCAALGVSPSGYYAWRSRSASAREVGDRRLTVEIRAVHRESRGTYGAPRVHAELRARGVACSKKRVARLMREAGVSGKAPGRRRRTMASAPLGPVAENVLGRAFEPEAPDRSWTADITQIWTAEGWLYLAVVLDLHSRRVVGWAARPSASRALVVEALTGSLRSRRPAPGLVLHSDQGSQYTSHEYQTLLRRHGIVASMSRRGNCQGGHTPCPQRADGELLRDAEVGGRPRPPLRDAGRGPVGALRLHRDLLQHPPSAHVARLPHAGRTRGPASPTASARACCVALTGRPLHRVRVKVPPVGQESEHISFDTTCVQPRELVVPTDRPGRSPVRAEGTRRASRQGRRLVSEIDPAAERGNAVRGAVEHRECGVRCELKEDALGACRHSPVQRTNRLAWASTSRGRSLRIRTHGPERPQH